jgi:pantoate ligase/cytidylate kinase
VDETEVTQAIRTAEVTAKVSTVAAQPTVRQVLLRQQQAYGTQGGVVMEGRDIGTHVFPAAELKIFLTASVKERARRRQQDLLAQNQPPMSLEALEAAIDERDRKDSTRRVAPLQKAEDAIELLTDGLSIDDVVTEIVALFNRHAN